MEFNEMIDYGNNLIIIDSLNLAFRFKWNNTKDYANKYIDTVKSLANSYGANKIILAGDWGSSWRKEIYPEYKANRKALRDKQTEEEAEEFKNFLAELEKAVIIAQISDMIHLRYKGCEADDIAAFVSIHYKDSFDKIWLVSSDKDWDLLVNDTVSRFSYVTRREYTLDNFEDHYGYPQHMHLDVKILQGDKSDNIPNAEGIGEKRAYTLLKRYGSIFDIYDSIPIPGKQKFIENLNNFQDQLLVNAELMDLHTYCRDALLNNVPNIIEAVDKYIEE